jgi:hypothetical protein
MPTRTPSFGPLPHPLSHLPKISVRVGNPGNVKLDEYFYMIATYIEPGWDPREHWQKIDAIRCAGVLEKQEPDRLWKEHEPYMDVSVSPRSEGYLYLPSDKAYCAYDFFFKWSVSTPGKYRASFTFYDATDTEHYPFEGLQPLVTASFTMPVASRFYLRKWSQRSLGSFVHSLQRPQPSVG